MEIKEVQLNTGGGKKEMKKTMMSDAMIEALTKEVLDQLEGGDKKAIRDIVYGYVAKEAARQFTAGRQLKAESLTLVKVARILRKANNAQECKQKFSAEVPNWRKVYPVAVGGQLRWKKLFDIPTTVRKTKNDHAHREMSESIARMETTIAELTTKVDAMFVELGDSCKRIMQLETGLTVHGESANKLETEFHKLEELVTAPHPPATNGLELAAKFIEFLSQQGK